MELKAIVGFFMIVLTIYNFITYKPVDSSIFGMNAPSPKSIILFIITIILFIYALYLNNYPIFIKDLL
jgi:hypothetical protein